MGVGVDGCAHLGYRGSSLIRNRPHSLGPPKSPTQRPTVGFWGGVVSYERGTSVCLGVGVEGLGRCGVQDLWCTILVVECKGIGVWGAGCKDLGSRVSG